MIYLKSLSPLISNLWVVDIAGQTFTVRYDTPKKPEQEQDFMEVYQFYNITYYELESIAMAIRANDKEELSFLNLKYSK